MYIPYFREKEIERERKIDREREREGGRERREKGRFKISNSDRGSVKVELTGQLEAY